MDSSQTLRFVAFALVLSFFASLQETAAVGINYGMLGNNLPSPDDVISLYKSRNITDLRIFNPNATVQTALKNSGIGVVIGTYNEDLQQLATSTSFASNWVATNIVPFADTVKFRYVTAGNEVVPGELQGFVLPAIKNLDAAMKAAGVNVKVSTAVSSQVLSSSFPPSNGTFVDVVGPIVEYLESTSAPLLINVYPYFAYADNSGSVSLDYALFKSTETVVQDGDLAYTNLFDAIVDATYFALEKSGGPSVDIVVSETGWPSGGDGVGATVENAQTYANNLVAHLRKNVGTPKKPGKEIETYLFAMFNENQKPAGTEQNFGLYHPDMTEVYHVDFSA